MTSFIPFAHVLGAVSIQDSLECMPCTQGQHHTLHMLQSYDRELHAGKGVTWTLEITHGQQGPNCTFTLLQKHTLELL